MSLIDDADAQSSRQMIANDYVGIYNIVVTVTTY